MTAPARTTVRGTSRFVALVTYVFRACLPRRRLAVLALPVGTIVLCGLLANTVDRPDTFAFAEVANIGIFGLAMPLGALIIGDAVLGAEVRSGTLAFTWLTPTPLREIAVARWLGGVLVSLATLTPAAALAAVLAGVPSEIGPIVVATGAGAAGHIALFVLIGAVTRRAAVWSLAVVFLIERLLGAALSGIAQLSPTWLGRSVYVGYADAPADLIRSGVPHGADGVARLALLTAVFLALATVGLRRLQLTGARD